jgi:hypothetical protein
VECDAGQSIATVAESVSSLAVGDVLGPEGGDGRGARFLEFVLERKAATAEISAMDS